MNETGRNHYAVLGISPDATAVLIKAAFRALAKQYHPDTHSGEVAVSSEKFTELHDAYKVLSNTGARKAYDKQLGFIRADDLASAVNEEKETRIEPDEIWNDTEKKHPDINRIHVQFCLISIALANRFRLAILNGKHGDNPKALAARLEREFFQRYFGDELSVQALAKRLLLRGHKRAARALNEAVKAGTLESREMRELYLAKAAREYPDKVAPRKPQHEDATLGQGKKSAAKKAARGTSPGDAGLLDLSVRKSSGKPSRIVAAIAASLVAIFFYSLFLTSKLDTEKYAIQATVSQSNQPTKKPIDDRIIGETEILDGKILPIQSKPANSTTLGSTSVIPVSPPASLDPDKNTSGQHPVDQAAANQQTQASKNKKTLLELFQGANDPLPAKQTVTTTPAAPKQQAAVTLKSAPLLQQTAPTQTASTGDGYFVQLASFRSQAEASVEFSRLKVKHGSTIGDLHSVINPAIVGGTTRYRLAIGPLSTREQATSLCSSLVASGERDCLVRKQYNEVIPARKLLGEKSYPDITAGELPYGDGTNVGLDAESAPEGGITIVKTLPGQTTDETFIVKKGSNLVDEITNRGVTKEAALALVAAIESIQPVSMIEAGTGVRLKLDHQQDFYGHIATFPIELSFLLGPNESISVEADKAGHFAASVKKLSAEHLVLAPSPESIERSFQLKRTEKQAVLALRRMRLAEEICMARAVYFEARSESDPGQRAIARVILNRINDPAYPKTICGVVYQNSNQRNSCQFSFACDGQPDLVDKPDAWTNARRITQMAMSDTLPVNIPNTATHYHSDAVHPKWADSMTRLVKIGHYIFYQKAINGHSTKMEETTGQTQIKTPEIQSGEAQAVQDLGTRIALVIGNSTYRHVSRLENPDSDAELMAVTLQKAGFKVTKLIDADQSAMKKAMLEFGRELRRGADASLFYYSGHGVQVKAENYLIPVDASIRDEDEVGFQAIDVNAFLQTMDSSPSKVKIVVLDACRDNPFANQFRSASRGLASVTAPSGTYIAYSTAPGSVAEDGDGKNSPYTTALAEFILRPGLKIEEAFKQTRIQVMKASSQKQVPWETTSLTGDFYFVPE